MVLAPERGPASSVALKMPLSAERLGAVYNYLAAVRGLPFDTWAIPTQARTGQLHGPLYQALGYVYLVDQSGRQNIGLTAVTNRYLPYKADYDAVISPALRDAAIVFSKEALNGEENALTTLLTKLQVDPALPERLEAAARLVAREVRLEATGREIEQMLLGRLDETTWRQAKRKEVARAVRTRMNNDLSTLFAHPEGVAIVAAYSKSSAKGTELATSYVEQAVDALRDFRREINADPALIWRYSFFILGGARKLGLANIEGFNEYAVSVARVLAPSKLEEAVGFAGMAVACLGLVFTGPVGLLVISAADLALSGAGTALAYIREREHELAGEASQFRASSEKFAIKAGYRDTVISGAASLLSAISFFKATREFRELIKPRLTAPEFSGAPRSPTTGEPKSSRLRGGGGDSPGPRTTRDPRSRRTRVPEGPTGASKETSGASEAKGSRGDMNEPSGKTSAHEGAADTSGRPAPDARGTSRTVDLSVDPEAQMVSQGPLPAGLRSNLEAQIEDLERTIQSQLAERQAVQEQLRSIDNQVGSARLLGRTDTDEYRALVARQQALKDELESFALDELRTEKYAKERELKALLRTDEQGYFKTLTNDARKRRDYITTAASDLDSEFFLPYNGETEVDHLHPRIDIWNTPGFKENLTRDQQVFLFTYRGNLKRVPWPLNSARGMRRYNSLPSATWRPYVKDLESLTKLDNQALDMRTFITNLINNPRNAEMWKRAGYLPKK